MQQPTYAQRLANADAVIRNLGGPINDAAWLRKKAARYERDYRSMRRAKRQQPRHLILGVLETARAFYALARRAEG